MMKSPETQTSPSAGPGKSTFLKIPFLIGTTITIIFASSAGASSCSSKGYSGPTDSITLATLHLASSALIYVAEEKQYFAENGLAVTVKDYDTGLATTDAVMKGDADLGTVAEFVSVGSIFQKQGVDVLGTMDKTLTTNIIGLKSRGVSKIADLAGKRIGLGKGTSSEFYLGRFLNLNGISISDVVMVNEAPAKLQDALTSGDVDAIVGWAPYTLQIQDHFANDTVMWNIQNSQPVFGNIVGSTEWVAAHPEIVTRFWKSIAQASDFMTYHQDEAKIMIQTRLGLEKSYIDTIWPQYTFTISLDQTLILAMEDEARWMISDKLTTETAVPNFLNNIYVDGMKSAKPDAVKIAGK
jgi:NitT/TauT family transport system substrate-binding protein